MEHEHHSEHGAISSGEVMAIDPVCGMKVNPAKPAATAEYLGRMFYFCSKGCGAKFNANPVMYAEKAAHASQAAESKVATSHHAAHAHSHHAHHGHDHHAGHAHPVVAATAAAAAPGTMFTCPMHPEVRQEGPGACPKCGMALEPELASADAGPNLELIDMTRRFWVGLVLTLPIFFLAMAEHVPGLYIEDIISPEISGWVQFALSIPVVLWAGWPFFVRGWNSLATRNLNMYTLVMLGVGVAFGYSVVALLAPGLFPRAFQHHPGFVSLYFEAATVIAVLVLLGEVLQLRARDNTSSAIRALLKLAPQTAHRLREDGSDEEIALDQVSIGDKLRVKPGDKVPVDGTVIEGHSTVDESLVTGEPIPVEKHAGEKVTGGTLNGNGSFVMKAERVGSETLLAQIVQMVAEAQRTRAPIQNLADKVSAWFVPAVVGVAILAFIVWSIYGPPPSMAFALAVAVSVLIIACPCALGLATPMSIMVGTGRGAQAGVLIRNAEALERLEKIDTLVVDKTGTLTEGKPRLATLVAGEGFTETQLLQAAASLERGSEHPLAAAILKGAQERGMVSSEIREFKAVTGKGVQGVLDGRPVALGNLGFVESLANVPQVLKDKAEQLRATGETVVYLADGGRAAGIISVADPIKATTAEALRELAAEGIHVVMLTGDNETTARAVAKRLGIEEVRADVLPQEKGAVVKALRAQGRSVAMAGDGVNDAPALAEAEVGIAMGTGSDVAIQSAGVTLVKGDLRGIVRARRLSRATMSNIRQNLFLAFVYNALGVPIAAGVLFPITGLLLNPMIAALAMSLSSVSVVTNALRLRSARI
jgi:Cu+-exporting ATPase